MTDADWLAAVAAAPDDPLVRLVYADWLDDQGDSRGEQLRLDVALAGLTDDNPAADPLRRRLAELVPGTDARWRAAVCRVPASYDGWSDSGTCMCTLQGLPDETNVYDLFLYVFPGYHALIRQPANISELRLLLTASRVCSSRSVRYEGTDPVVLQMLGDAPQPQHLTPIYTPPVTRVITPTPRWQEVLFPDIRPIQGANDLPRVLVCGTVLMIGSIVFALFCTLLWWAVVRPVMP